LPFSIKRDGWGTIPFEKNPDSHVGDRCSALIMKNSQQETITDTSQTINRPIFSNNPWRGSLILRARVFTVECSALRRGELS
jgi:hypothetical protein